MQNTKLSAHADATSTGDIESAVLNLDQSATAAYALLHLLGDRLFDALERQSGDAAEFGAIGMLHLADSAGARLRSKCGGLLSGGPRSSSLDDEIIAETVTLLGMLGDALARLIDATGGESAVEEALGVTNLARMTASELAHANKSAREAWAGEAAPARQETRDAMSILASEPFSSALSQIKSLRPAIIGEAESELAQALDQILHGAEIVAAIRRERVGR